MKKRPLLILRPEPGNAATRARAEALEFETIGCPLFEVSPRAWDAPDPADFDAVLLTSANGARHAGADLARFLRLPAYAVGAKTAGAARDAGFAKVFLGDRDVDALLDRAAGDEAKRLLHLAGADRTAFAARDLQIETRIVYESVALPHPDGLAAALARRPIALLHSVRAAKRFADLVADRGDIATIAISAQVAEAAGNGWREVAVSDEPRDEAMLALAQAQARNQGSR